MEHQVQCGLFSSEDDVVCMDDRSLLVALSENIQQPLFVESLGIWLMSIDGLAWVEVKGSAMGIADGAKVEVFGAGNLNAWLVVEIMNEGFPSFIGTAIMGNTFKAEVVGTNTVSIMVSSIMSGDSEAQFFSLSTDGWLKLKACH